MEHSLANVAIEIRKDTNHHQVQTGNHIGAFVRLLQSQTTLAQAQCVAFVLQPRYPQIARVKYPALGQTLAAHEVQCLRAAVNTMTAQTPFFKTLFQEQEFRTHLATIMDTASPESETSDAVSFATWYHRYLDAVLQKVYASDARLARIAPMPVEDLHKGGTILAVTWNTAGRGTRRSQKEWISSLSGKAWEQRLQTTFEQMPGRERQPPLVVVLALQEWNTQNQFPQAFRVWLNNAATKHGAGHQYIHTSHRLTTALRWLKRDFSQNLSIYVRDDYAALLHKSYRRAYPPTKAGAVCFGASRTCTKGSIVSRLRIPHPARGQNTLISLYVVASHFPFEGEANVAKRNQAFHKTIRAVPALAKESAAVIWQGDLNYRRTFEGQDQLRHSVEKGLVFDNYVEGVDDRGPRFLPTCKLNPLPLGADQERHEAWIRQRRGFGPQAYDPQRRPSHCDRILVKNPTSDQGLFVVKSYTSFVEGALESDHNAVMAIIQF